MTRADQHQLLQAFSRDYTRELYNLLAADLGSFPCLHLRSRQKASQAPIRTLAGHDGEDDARAFSPDGRRIVSASDDHTFRLWDAETGACEATSAGHTRQVSLAVHVIKTSSRPHSCHAACSGAP